MTEKDVLAVLHASRTVEQGRPTAPDFSNVDLSGLDLRTVPFGRACFRGGLLKDTDFSNADLSLTDFRQADLTGAKLIGTNLADVDLRGAIVRDANLCGACLFQADLRGSDMRGTLLDWADLGDVRVDEGTKVLPDQLTRARDVPASLLRVARAFQRKSALGNNPSGKGL